MCWACVTAARAGCEPVRVSSSLTPSTTELSSSGKDAGFSIPAARVRISPALPSSVVERPAGSEPRASKR